MMKYYCILLFFLIPVFAMAQDESDTQSTRQLPTDISVEFQAYPTGLIPGIRFEKGINQKTSVHLRIGMNRVRHRDLGVHEDERGEGFGFTFGYKRYLGNDFRNWHLGLKTDLWFNDIDWKDGIGTPAEVMGNTDIVVLQPTVEVGYTWIRNRLIFGPSLAFGYEINIKTKGENVGEGPILLVGLNFGIRI